MPRKCCTIWNGEPCDGNYDSSKERVRESVRIFRFPRDKDEEARWIRSLPNILTSSTTENLGVCVRHWPLGYKTTRKKGHDRPADPPSVFGVPKSLLPQIKADKNRNVRKRKVDLESRKKEVLPIDRDVIQSWDALLEFSKSLPLIQQYSSDQVQLLELDDNISPRVAFSILIDQALHVTAFRGNYQVKIKDLIPSFSHILNRYSQLNSIIARLKETPLDFKSELTSASNFIKDLSREETFEQNDQQRAISFLCNQLISFNSKVSEYSAETIKDAINIYLRSRSAYRELRKILTLPCENTLKSYFGGLDTPGSIEECKNTVKKVFEKLEENQKLCYLSVDEINVKPAIRYNGKSLIGYSVNTEEQCPAKSVLAMLINPSMGAPAFVGRLYPVSSLKGDFLYEQVKILIQIIHEAGGYCYLVMSDNLSVNQNAFRRFHESMGSVGIYAVTHPIKNERLDKLYLMYDPVHLLKNIRNNWITEKTQTLKFFDFETKSFIYAKWKDIVEIYKEELDNSFNVTKLSRQALWPNNFEKQKVKLVLDVFNEKVVVRLEQKGFTDTALFLKRVIRMWKILNIRSPETGKRLKDIDQLPVNDINDERLTFLTNMATSFKLMDNGVKGRREKGLTAETSNALHITLNGMVSICGELLRLGFKYVLPGKIQSDRVEKEFSIYRQGAGGNYFISVEEVLNTLNLERLKLFSTLEISHRNEELKDCCATISNDLEEESELVERSFTEASNLTMGEKSTLYFVSGYVARKENILDDSTTHPNLPESEFTELVSRGSLVHPPAELYDFSQYLLSFFKISSRKCCTNCFKRAFHLIYTMTEYSFPNIVSILRRYINCFFKAHANKETNKIAIEKDIRQTKKRRISSRLSSNE